MAIKFDKKKLFLCSLGIGSIVIVVGTITYLERCANKKPATLSREESVLHENVHGDIINNGNCGVNVGIQLDKDRNLFGHHREGPNDDTGEKTYIDKRNDKKEEVTNLTKMKTGKSVNVENKSNEIIKGKTEHKEDNKESKNDKKDSRNEKKDSINVNKKDNINEIQFKLKKDGVYIKENNNYGIQNINMAGNQILVEDYNIISLENVDENTNEKYKEDQINRKKNQDKNANEVLINSIII
ncbi:hypothetical protein COBT_001809 [Conglomerata obtusa]